MQKLVWFISILIFTHPLSLQAAALDDGDSMDSERCALFTYYGNNEPFVDADSLLDLGGHQVLPYLDTVDMGYYVDQLKEHIPVLCAPVASPTIDVPFVPVLRRQHNGDDLVAEHRDKEKQVVKSLSKPRQSMRIAIAAAIKASQPDESEQKNGAGFKQKRPVLIEEEQKKISKTKKTCAKRTSVSTQETVGKSASKPRQAMRVEIAAATKASQPDESEQKNGARFKQKCTVLSEEEKRERRNALARKRYAENKPVATMQQAEVDLKHITQGPVACKHLECTRSFQNELGLSRHVERVHPKVCILINQDLSTDSEHHQDLQ